MPKKISSKILQDSERSDTKFGMTIKMLIAKRLRLTNGKYGTMFSTGIELNVLQNIKLTFHDVVPKLEIHY